MNKLLLLCFVAILSGCQSVQNNENTELKQELAQLKEVQRQIAVKVGLGSHSFVQKKLNCHQMLYLLALKMLKL